jgi:hypothetical protein
MTITETIVITRANTSIEWPTSSAPAGPWLAATVITTSNISNDELTKTITKIWNSKEEFVTLHAYINPDVSVEAHFESITVPGLTHSRIIETTE